VIDYIKSEINLSEILKWEQDVEYMDPETAKIYKISDNNLYKKYMVNGFNVMTYYLQIIILIRCKSLVTFKSQDTTGRFL